MKVEIVVKKAEFVSFIETCLQFIGSGVYYLNNDVFTLNVSPQHVYHPDNYLRNVLACHGYRDIEQIYDYVVNI